MDYNLFTLIKVPEKNLGLWCGKPHKLPNYNVGGKRMHTGLGRLFLKEWRED